MADFTTVSVEHCPNSYALCLKSAAAGSSSSSSVQDWKIVFSGDCRPSLELVKVGIDADLLIHEATFECSDQIEAEDRRHCTTLEAIIVGKRMRAKYVLMNHFSGRYPSIPKFEDAAAILLQDTKMGVCAAFDCMSFTMDQLPRLPLFIPAVRLLYPKNVKEMVDVDTVDIESDVSANAVGRGGGKRGKGGRDAGYGRGRGGGGGGRGQGRKRERRHDHEDDLELPVGGGTKFDWIRMERNNEKK